MCDEHIAPLDQLLHVAEEERQQQRPNVRPVHVSVGHEDDFAVAQLGGIEIFLGDAGAQRRDHVTDAFMAEHLVVTGLLHVQNLALKRQNRLKTPIAALLGRAACGFALYQEEFAALGLALGTVGQLTRQAAAVHRAFATGQVTCLAGCFTRSRRFDGLIDNPAADRWVLLEERAQTLVYKRLHDSGNVGIQLALGLPFKLRLRQFYADHCNQAFAHVVAREIFLYVLEQPQLLAGIVDGAGEGGPESGEVRAAIHRVDVVRETENALRVAIVVLQPNLDHHTVALRLHVDRPFMEHTLAAVQVLDKFGDAAVVLEFNFLGLTCLRVGRPLIGQRNQQAFIQESQLAQALGQRIEVVFSGGEDGSVRLEVDLGAWLFGLASFLQLAGGLTFGVGLLPGKSVTADFELELFAERVNARNADAVQSTGNFVAGGIELAAGVQLGHYHLRCGNLFAVNVHVVHGNTAAVINYGDGIINVDDSINAIGIAGQRFVH